LGYNFKSFTSAQAFLEGTELEQVGCLIMNIMLPGMDGLQLQRELKKRGSIIPIVFITGYGEDELEKQVMIAGAHGYLNKPFDEQALINLIDSILRIASNDG